MEKHYRLSGSEMDFHFYPRGGPIDDETGTILVFELLGRTAAAWARMELFVEIILLHLNKEKESPEIYERHPKGFGNKVKLLKKYLQHPKLAPEKEIFLKSFNILGELAETRNDVLHSCITSYDPKTERIGFISLQPRGNDTFVLQSGEYSTQRLEALLSLAKKSTMALTELADLVMPNAEEPACQKALNLDPPIGVQF